MKVKAFIQTVLVPALGSEPKLWSNDEEVA